MTCIPIDNKFNFISRGVPSWTEYCYNDCINQAFPMYVFVRFVCEGKKPISTHTCSKHEQKAVS